MKHIKHFLLKILEAVSFSEALKESKGIFSNVNVCCCFFFSRIKSFYKRRCCREHRQLLKDPKRYCKAPGLLLLQLY